MPLFRSREVAAGAVTHGYQMNETNTGVIGAGLAYADLTPSGSITTTADGQVIERLDISTRVAVRHNNVTIRNCRIDGGLSSSYCVDFATETPVTGTVVEYCELTRGASAGIVHYSPYTLRYCHVHTWPQDALKAGGGTLIEYNYITGCYKTTDSHNDGIQIRRGDGITIRRNRIEGAVWQQQTGAILAQSADGTISNLTVEDNVLGAGSYTLYTVDTDGTPYAYTFGTAPEIHGNYFAGEDGSPSATNPNNSWQFGPRSSSVTCNESGNFYAPLVDPVNHPTPWQLDLNDLRVKD